MPASAPTRDSPGLRARSRPGGNSPEDGGQHPRVRTGGVEGSGPGSAPLDDPLAYPGARPSTSFLLDDGTVTLLRTRAQRVLPAVDHVLRRHSSVELVRRQAVLAIGSNASPSQLSAKLGGCPDGDTLVGLVVDVAGISARPSAHLSRRGYWP